MATNTDTNSETFLKKVDSLISAINYVGIDVDFTSTDMAPAFLGGFKDSVEFGKVFSCCGYEFPLKLGEKVFPILDMTHFLTKMKLRLFDDENDLWIGDFLATGVHLRMLVDHSDYSKLDHNLSHVDVSSRDRTKDSMSFNATEKIMNMKVNEALKSIPGSEGTSFYISIMTNLYEAFMKENVASEERVAKAIFSLSTLRRWRKYLKLKSLTIDSFISSQCFHAIEINVRFLIQLCLERKSELITCSNSQSCETFFRTLRTMTSSGLNQINFSIQEALMKINRIVTLTKVKQELKEHGFKFDKKQEKLRDLDPNVNFTTYERLCKVIKEASLLAESDCKNFGINCDDQVYLQFYPKTVTKNYEKETLVHNKINYGFEEFEFVHLETGEITTHQTVKIKNKNFLDEDMSKLK